MKSLFLDPKQDLSIESFNGMVKKVICQEYDFDTDEGSFQKSPGTTTTIGFNEYGDCTSYEVQYGELINPPFWNEDAEGWRDEYEYNERRLIRKTEYDQANSFRLSSDFFYDTAGKWIKTTHRFSNGTKRTVSMTHFRYPDKSEYTVLYQDENGKQTGRKTRKSDNNGRLLEEMQFDGADILISSRTHSYTSEHSSYEQLLLIRDAVHRNYIRSRYKHDLSGRLLEVVNYAGNGTIKDRLTVTYSGDTEVQTKYNSYNQIEWVEEHTYDSNKRIAELIRRKIISKTKSSVETHMKFISLYDDRQNQIYSESVDMVHNSPISKEVIDIEYFN